MWRCYLLMILTLAKFRLRVISISRRVWFSYKCGCWWFHMWLNHENLWTFSRIMSSPAFSSGVPWWKYFPEKPRLNLNPGIIFCILSWVSNIAWLEENKNLQKFTKNPLGKRHVSQLFFLMQEHTAHNFIYLVPHAKAFMKSI